MRELEGITPPEIADLIRPYIEGKVVCDVGCGEGTFMDSLAKYASKVIGVEEEDEWAYRAAYRHEVYPVGSYHQPLPKADVYYLWTKDAQGTFLKAKWEGTKGTFIFGKTVRPSLTRFLEAIKAKRIDHPTLDWWVYVTKI
jgi:hypothetical protein